MTELLGTANNDSLTVLRGGGTVAGLEGNDTIRGSGQNDVIFGDAVSVINTGPRPAPIYGYQILEDRVAAVTVLASGNEFKNAVGMYRVGADGKILGVEIMVADASTSENGSATVNVNLKAGEQVGFFVMPNGFAKNPAVLQRTDGHYTFLDSNGAAGRMGSGPDLALWFVPADGSAPVRVVGEYGKTMFFSRTQLNSDNISHVQTKADAETGLVQFGFEETLNGGDSDFNDVQFQIDVGTANVSSFPTTKYTPPVASDDVLRGGNGDDRILGGAGNDMIYGEAGNDTLEGGTGNDRLWGGAGTDLVSGGSGNDSVWGGAGNDTLNGGGGNDSLYGGDGNDTLLGSAGDDVLTDGKGNDTVNGGSGLDRFIAGAGNDAYNGSDGFDTIDFSMARTGIAADLGLRTITGDLGADTIRGVEKLLATRFADTLTGSRFADTLEGRAGNDIIRGAAGSDILSGGLGADRFLYTTRSELLNTATGQRFVDTIKDFNIRADKIDVTALLGERVGERSEMFRLDESQSGTMLQVNMGRSGWFDLVFLKGEKLGDAEKVTAGWLDYGKSIAATSTVATGNPDNVLWGTDAEDSFSGGAGNDRLWDLGGNDTMRGGNDHDLVTAGRGDDLYNGDAGFDTIDFGAARSGVVVDLTAKTAIGDLGKDQVLNFEVVLGTGFDDRVTGNRFDEMLNGQDGNDILRGMQGSDTLVGGAGADTFVYGSRSDMYNSGSKVFFADIIRDFDAAVDSIDISGVLAGRTGDKSLLVQLDETAAGTVLKVNLGTLGWADVALLEGVMLGDQSSVSADWLIV